MTERHVSEEQWADLLSGEVDAETRRHVESCPRCLATLDEVRTGWDWAHAADVPEPSPLYWESFRKSVGERIASESARPARLGFTAWRFALAAAAVVALTLSVFTVRERGPIPRPTAVSVFPAWSPLPPSAEDAGLPVLSALDATSDLASEGCGELSACLVDLSEEEGDQVSLALRQELKGRSL